MLLAVSTTSDVYIACYDFVFSLYRHEHIFQMATSLGSELTKRHGRDKAQLIVIVAVEFFFLYSIYAASLVATGIQIVQILYEAMTCEGYRKRIHGMMAMVVAFSPILYASYLASVRVFIDFC